MCRVLLACLGKIGKSAATEARRPHPASPTPNPFTTRSRPLSPLRKRSIQLTQFAVAVLGNCCPIFCHPGARSIARDLGHGAYAGALQMWVRGLRKWGKVRLDIVRKAKCQRGFVVVPWR